MTDVHRLRRPRPRTLIHPADSPDAAVVARRGHLPGLPALLGRRRRRRHRRPARHHRAGCRYLRDLGVDALWITPVLPLAAGRRRLRRRRLPRRRPAVRHARRRRRAARARRTSSACGSSSTWCPTTPPTSTRGSRRRWPPAPGSPERDALPLPRRARARTASCRPNNWESVFGGPAWTRVTEPTARPASGTCTSSTRTQPDLNWAQPGGRATSSTTILRFWLDRGVDGFRVDVAHGLVKDDGPARLGRRADDDAGAMARGERRRTRPMWDQDDVHEIYRALAPGPRRVRRRPDRSSPRPGPRPPERAGRATSAPTSCTRRSTSTSCAPLGRRGAARRSSTTRSRAVGSVGAPPTWVLSNHDVVRHASRLGLPAGRAAAQRHRRRRPAAGRRARACAGPAPRPLLMLALPGSAYLYQGEELGLPEVDRPARRRTARTRPCARTDGARRRGRDGCRVPIPWVDGRARRSASARPTSRGCRSPRV